VSESEERWELNYFNYFTEVEEHFQRARGTGLFLLSPLDWALIEGWKNAGIPLGAVLRGIDAAFEKWRNRKPGARTRTINSLAYCTQAVIEEAQAMAGVEAKPSAAREAAPPFSVEALREFLEAGLTAIRRQPGEHFASVIAAIEKILAELEAYYEDLEGLEQRLTVLEEKMASIARIEQTEDQLLATRQKLDSELRPYRGKMSADQLTMLEKQYTDRRLLETSGLPRLSLFYLG